MKTFLDRFKQTYILAIIMPVSLFLTQTASALTETVDGVTYTYTVANGQATIGTGPSSLLPAIKTSTSGTLTIPSSLGGYPVVTIGCSAFEGCANLTAITIPNSVSTIDRWSFSCCYSLSSITIPSSVTTIDYRAFEDCINLISITIPNSVINMDGEAFCGCSNLLSFSVESTNPNYSAKDGILFDKNSNTLICCPEGFNGEYTIPDSVTIIGSWAFANCIGLTSVTIPNNVTNINGHAFRACDNLTSVTIPDSVISLGDGAFNSCSRLASIKMSANISRCGQTLALGTAWWSAQPSGSVVYLGKCCLGAKDTFVGDLSINAGTTCIADYSFFLCSGLTSITIPDGVTYLGKAMFYDCSSLASITIPDSVTYIGERAFYGCRQLTSITIPSNVTYIGEQAFYDCRSLPSLTIPASVMSIGNRAFWNCISVKTVRYLGDAPALGNEDFHGIYSGTPADLVSFVTKGTKGWDGNADSTALPSIWPVTGSDRRAIQMRDVLITLNASGGSVTPATTNMPSGVVYGVLPVATRLGYAQTGWFTDAIDGVEVTADSIVPEEATTLYAQWEVVDTTITFDANGGTVNVTSQDFAWDEAYGSLPTATRLGYVQTGWFTSAIDGEKVTMDSIVPNAGGVILYAQWALIDRTITFDANAGTVDVTSQNFAWDEAYGSLPTATRLGYAQTGWFTEAVGGDKVMTNSIVPNAEGVILYAQWEAVDTIITFDANGGTLSATSQGFAWGEPYGQLPLPVYSGYAFVGWFTAVVRGTQVTEDSIVPNAEGVILYAQWGNGYTLTVKNGTAGAVKFIAGAEVEVTANDAPLNQEFQKWTMSPTSTVFAEGFSVNDATTKIIMPAANVTMTAVYVKAPGSLGIECVPNNGQTVTGVEWSTDKKTWYSADVTQRLTSGAYTVYFRSTDGKWIVSASTKITLNAGSADAPTLVPVACEFAPAFDGDTLDDATDPNSDQGQWNEESGQLDWTGLRVGLRAKLGPLPLQANATSVKLKSGKLPAGLKLVTVDEQVYLSGIPTKAGTYPAVLQAMEGRKLGALLPVVWTVQDLPTEYIGTFNGVYTATTNDTTSHSALTLTVAKTGKLTGSASLGGKKYSLKADAFDAIDYDTEAMSVTNAAFICTNPKLTNAVSLTISLSEAGLGMFEVTPLPTATGDYNGQAVRNGWKDKVKHALRVTAVNTVNGYYTLSLYPEDDSYGAGYVTLTVDTKGGVKAAGKLADGTAVSGSGVLLVTDEEVSTIIALSPSAYKGGEFYLNVKFIQDAQPRVDAAEPVNWVNPITTTTSNGPFERKPEVKGGWYSKTETLYTLYGVGTPYRLGLEAEVITNAVSVNFNTKGTGVDALSKTNNPYNVKLTLTPKTGLFSGSFNETGVKTAYKLYGILTPYLVTDTDDTAGLGFYSIPVVVPKTQRSELFRLTTQAVEP